MKNNAISPIHEVMDAKLQDLMVPGVVVEFDPIEADSMGAFPEDAITEIDAYDSMVDLLGEDR